MRESEYINRWRNEGIDLGVLRTRREDLLDAVKLRLEDPVPETIRLAIQGTNDLDTLIRWYRAALTLDSIADFRKAMNLTP